MKTKDILKRSFALLLVFIFCFGLLPSNGFALDADGNEPETELTEQQSSEAPETAAPGIDETAPTPTPQPTEEEKEAPEEYPVPELIPVPGAGSNDAPARRSLAAARAAAESMEVMRFSWNGTEYSVITGSSGTASGMSWSCEADGSFTMEFTASGTLTIISGEVKNGSVQVIGGGAGGSSAYGRSGTGFGEAGGGYGGAGGGAGAIVTGTVNLAPGETVQIIVGQGGVGGQPSSTELVSSSTQGLGTAGGYSSFGSIVADGGTVNGGGAGADHIGPGSVGADRSGGGGGSVDRFEETDCGNFRYGNFSCWLCGTNEGYYDYNVSGWTPRYVNAYAPDVPVNGGLGFNGGGTGGTPENEHGHGPRDGGNGAAGTGGGGGGGAYGSRIYQLGSGYGYGSTGSAISMGFAGRGGDGGSGLVTLTGLIDPKIKISFLKASANPEMTNGNSCYSLAGAVYGVYSDAACTDLVASITTDANGQAVSGELERGMYYIKEITPPTGYLLDKRIYTADGRNGSVTLNVTDQPGNDPVGISITKITDDPAATLPSLEGTQFTIKFYGGQYSSAEELPDDADRTWIIETKARSTSNGIKYEAFLMEQYKIGGDDFYYYDGKPVIPIGTLTIQETKPADGYTTTGGWASDTTGNYLTDADGLIILNVESTDSLSSGGALRYGNEYTKVDKPIYGGFIIQKIDAETGLAAPQGGASLAGMELEIFLAHTTENQHVTVNGVEYYEGDVVYTGVTDENGVFKTPEDLLPPGAYGWRETKAPEGYHSEQTGGGGYLHITHEGYNVNEDGFIVGDASGVYPGVTEVVSDQIYRSDFTLLKQNGDTKEPMANVRFSITSNTTGESHEFYTDENGRFSSRIEVVDPDSEDMPFSSMDNNGVRFGAALPELNTFWKPGMDAANALGNKAGALIYDTYTIRELPCEANRGYALADPVVFTVSEAMHTIEIVGVYNYEMSISTSASFVGGSNEKWTLAAGTVTARDAVTYSNFIPGTRYILKSALWNKTDGEFLMDEDGNELTWEHSFTANRGGVENVELSFNADGLAGKDIVIFQSVYLEPETAAMRREEPNLTQPIIIHADPDDEAQTLHFLQPEIGTTVHDAATGTNVSFMAEEITLIDTVTYSNLIPNRRYTVTGVLMDAKTGEKALDADGNEIHAEEEFVALESSGTANVTFKFKGKFETAQKFVAFEELYYEGSLLAVHADINDEGQTLYIPKIRTSALVPLTGQHLGLTADILIIRDTVYYEGMKPGAETVISGQVADSAAPDAILGGAISTFTPETEDGEVTIDLQVAAKDFAGRRLVVYEALLINGKPVAEHRDANDEDQSVHIPEVGTTATDSSSGAHWAIADDDVTIVDTVKVKNIIPCLEYDLKGWAVLKSDTRKVLAEAELSFTPDVSTHEVEMSFNFDGTELAGDAVVIFERLYYNGIEIAAHADPNDEGQTVVFPKITTELLISGGKEAVAADHMTAIDTVSYINFPVGEQLTAVGVLMDKDTGKPVKDAAGKEILVEQSFAPEASEGSVGLTFAFDGTGMDGKTLVAFDRIYLGTDTNGQPIALHEDIDSAAQSIKLIKATDKPKTGDAGDPLACAALMAFSAGGAALTCSLLKRREEEL